MKNFKDLTPRDNELDSGFIHREISVSFYLLDPEIKITAQESEGRLDLQARIEEAGSRFHKILDTVNIPEDDGPHTMPPTAQLELRFMAVPDNEEPSTEISTMATICMDENNRSTITADLIKQALPAFSDALNRLGIELQ